MVLTLLGRAGDAVILLLEFRPVSGSGVSPSSAALRVAVLAGTSRLATNSASRQGCDHDLAVLPRTPPRSFLGTISPGLDEGGVAFGSALGVVEVLAGRRAVVRPDRSKTLWISPIVRSSRCQSTLLPRTAETTRAVALTEAGIKPHSDSVGNPFRMRETPAARPPRERSWAPNVPTTTPMDSALVRRVRAPARARSFAMCASTIFAALPGTTRS